MTSTTTAGGPDTAALRRAVDRSELTELAGRFTDALNLRLIDDFAALWTEDGVWDIPGMNARFETRDGVRAGVGTMLGLWDFFVQTAHPGRLDVDGDRATGRVYSSERGRMPDGTSMVAYAVYDDEYRRVDGHWLFARRTFHFLYRDDTPFGGVALPAPALSA